MTEYALRSPAYLTGTSFGYRFLHDEPTDAGKRNVDFHVTAGDYFGTLATVLNLIADSLATSPSELTRPIRTLREVREDLMYLQETCVIEKRS